MDYLVTTRIVALRNVVNSRKTNPDVNEEFLLRHVFRWYSKTFSTPLHLVEDLPLEDVLMAYWEDKYEIMEDEALDEEVCAVAEDPAETTKRQRNEDMAEADVFEMMEEETASMKRTINKASNDVLRSVKNATDKLAQMLTADKGAPTLTPAEGLTIPPDITMTFLSEDDELKSDQDSLGIF